MTDPNSLFFMFMIASLSFYLGVYVGRLAKNRR